jgi:hypothetical protein
VLTGRIQIGIVIVIVVRIIIITPQSFIDTEIVKSGCAHHHEHHFSNILQVDLKWAPENPPFVDETPERHLTPDSQLAQVKVVSEEDLMIRFFLTGEGRQQMIRANVGIVAKHILSQGKILNFERKGSFSVCCNFVCPTWCWGCKGSILHHKSTLPVACHLDMIDAVILVVSRKIGLAFSRFFGGWCLNL